MQGQLFPFSKNRYFRKKRMRSADFERDQAFADNKLSFLNHWVFGSGIAMGLGAVRVDSDSILVEPGVAVDGQGRYLIVDEPAVCHVRTLEGFPALPGETAVLWLSYREEDLDPMFVSDDEGQSMRYTVARERFSFSLRAESPLEPSAAERLVFSYCVLFEDEDVRVTQILPKALSADKLTLLSLSVECFCPEPLDLELAYAPNIPGFVDGGSGGEPQLRRRLRTGKGETVLALPVRPVGAGQAVSVSLPEEGFSIEKRGLRQNARCSFRQEFPVVAGDPVAALEELLVSSTLQELWEADCSGVPIARVRFVRYEEQCLLDDVIPLPPRRRVAVPYLRECLRRAGECFAAPPAGEVPQSACKPSAVLPPHAQEGQPPGRMATGSLLLQTGGRMRAGSVLASDEIAHGLGPGTVYVGFGVENVYPVANLDRNRTDLLLGDVSLFEQASGTYDQDMDRGVRVHPDKGTFELAVRLGGDLHQSTLRLRWFAWRPDGAAAVKEEEEVGTLLKLEPDVIHAAPGAVISFTPVFAQGQAAPCDFSTEGKHSGVVTRDGVYTAPDREGLYQVFAQVRGRPEQRTSAFVLVEAPDEEEKQGGV